ncbi:cytochrome P450 [Micromonospora sp. NPDC049240]|uniref:cytochrome P450 n=1 Tax=Micromonospora sp. NPDC049240 TaxID=3155151 RepID=UPI0033D8C1EB
MTQTGPSRQSAPLQWLRELRESHGVAWDESMNTWYVTRYDDVYALLNDPRLGAQVETYCPPGLSERQRRTYWRVTNFVDLWPVFSDPPRHSGMRRLLLPLFTPAVIRQVVAAVAGSVAASSTTVPADRMFAAVVRPALTAGLCRLLDEPEEALAELADCAARILAIGAIESYDPESGLRAEQAMDELVGLVAERCATPRSAFTSTLSRAVSEERLNLLDAAAMYAQIVSGALEPAATAVARLLEALTGPQGAAIDLAEDLDEAVDEALRLATPFHLATRRALTDLTLHGHAVRAESRVVLVLVTANSDPRRFPDPFTFRVDRTGARHVAFGRGRHACLGAVLTRHVMREMILELNAQGLLRDLPPLEPVWNVEFGSRFVYDVVAGASSTTPRPR